MKIIKITFRLDCWWELLPPSYRIYFDGELLIERTYTWDNSVETIEETFFVNAEPGHHQVFIESLVPKSGKFSIINPKYESPTNEDISDTLLDFVTDK